MRSVVKQRANALLALAGLGLISNDRGPRGYPETCRRALAEGFTPKTIVDIGASNGKWARECMAVFPKAEYLLIDALPENAKSLGDLARNARRIKIWSGALGTGNGRSSLFLHGDQLSFLPSVDFPGPMKQVEVRTLDSFLESEDLMRPLLIKADVQGYEPEVFKGATRSLALAEMVIVEVSFRRIYQSSPLAHEVIAFMGTHGFRIYDVSSYVQRSMGSALLQSDLVSAREDSDLFRSEGWN